MVPLDKKGSDLSRLTSPSELGTGTFAFAFASQIALGFVVRTCGIYWNPTPQFVLLFGSEAKRAVPKSMTTPLFNVRIGLVWSYQSWKAIDKPRTHNSILT